MLQETMKKITDAESEADEIIRKAKEEADYTVAAAKKEAADMEFSPPRRKRNGAGFF